MSLNSELILNCERTILECDVEHRAVLKLLDDEGYNHYINPKGEGCYTFQKRIDDGVNALCHTNDQLYMNVEVWLNKLGDKIHRSVSMGMVHQNAECQWFELSCYGNSPETFVDQYQIIFNKLYTAWNAVYFKEPKFYTEANPSEYR